MKRLTLLLNELIRYAEDAKILDPYDREYATNTLLYLFGLDAFTVEAVETPVDFFATMDGLLAHALKKGLIALDVEPLRDNFEAKLMDAFLPRPAELNRQFAAFLNWQE
ncbi:MAG: hypothetical protein Q8N15_02820, partial [Bacillota bacterium]|nr:hypothetical protein [Bacillota bacterium]